MLVRLFKSAIFALVGMIALVAVIIGLFAYRNASVADENWFSFIYPSFYLKIVDQYGNPVPGVKVDYSNGSSGLLSFNYSWNSRRTIDDGTLEFKLDGREFKFHNFERDGYQIQFGPQVELLIEENYSHNFYPSFLKRFKRDSPLVLRAWKLPEEGYPRVSKARSWYRLEFSRTYAFDLKKNRKPKARKVLEELSRASRGWSIYSSELTQNSSPNLEKPKKSESQNMLHETPPDLQVKLQINHANEWMLTLWNEEGGLQEADDLYMNEAPVYGYQKAVFLKGNIAHRELNRSYYLKSSLGYYGKIHVSIRPHNEKGPLLVLTHVMNLDKDRNLEVDKETEYWATAWRSYQEIVWN